MGFLKDIQVNDKVCIKTAYSEEWATVLKVEGNLFEVSGYRIFDKYTGKPDKSVGYHATVIGLKKANMESEQSFKIKLKVYQPSCIELDITVDNTDISKEDLELLGKDFVYGLDEHNYKLYCKIINQLALLPKNVKPIDDVFARFELIKD
jgi:hypothetical protein